MGESVSLERSGGQRRSEAEEQTRKTAYWSTIQAVAKIWMMGHFLLITRKPTMKLVEFRRWIARQLFAWNGFTFRKNCSVGNGIISIVKR